MGTTGKPTEEHAVVIEWGSASVSDARLSVELSAPRPKGWSDRFEAVVAQLATRGQRWGEVSLGKRRLHVEDVTAGAEEDLRHFLESAVLQANAAVGAEPGEDKETGPDADMAARFRSFAEH
jgi:hypothetical protein